MGKKLSREIKVNVRYGNRSLKECLKKYLDSACRNKYERKKESK